MSKANYSENAFPQPTTKRRVDTEAGDYYPTPEWATFALTEVEQISGMIWEPACGGGHMSDMLALSTGCPVYSTDLFNRGFGVTGVDFLNTTLDADWIITNPPYHLAEEFVHHALKCAKNVAMLLRTVFVEGQGRYNTLFLEKPPTRIWQFPDRITFYPEGKQTGGSGTTAYAWFVWIGEVMAAVEYLPRSELRWIQPGAKKRHHDFMAGQSFVT